MNVNLNLNKCNFKGQFCIHKKNTNEFLKTDFKGKLESIAISNKKLYAGKLQQDIKFQEGNKNILIYDSYYVNNNTKKTLPAIDSGIADTIIKSQYSFEYQA